ITMEGAEEYHIELNGALTTTTSPALVLNLSKGINHLKVQSKMACQGVFEKQFLLLDKPQAYPNPFDEIVSIRLDQTVEELSVATYTLAGKFIKEKTYRPTGHSLNLDFSGLPSGSYLLRLKGSVTNTTIHVIKK
ncbi:T9SS type A sorting domain-containing protein, partial [Arenibacter lacus]